MSYILDALKKSEQSRSRGSTPTLQSVHTVAVAHEPRRRWIYAATAVALAIAAFGIGWIRPWQPQPQVPPAPVAAAPVAPETRRTQPALPEPAAPIPASAVLSREERRAEAPSAASAPRAKEPEKAAAIEPSRELRPPSRESSPEVATPGAEAPQVKRAAPASAPSARDKTPEDDVPALADLPAAVRSELPALTISLHAYFPAAKDRLVSVNGRLLHEGEPLNSELSVERITPDGVIFNHKGTRFRRGVR